jgi:nucleoside-diphosphate-sugar epimerase
MTTSPVRRIIISGGTGVVGAALIKELLPQLPEDVEVVCLVRSQRSLERLSDLFDRDVMRRIRPLPCDLTEDIDIDHIRSTLPEANTAVGVHCAADVSWDKEMAEVENLNIRGSIRFVRLVGATTRDPRLIYVSSAYTSTEGWEYRNAYERSKATAERELRRQFPELPTATFSCSLVIGRVSDGAIQRYHGLYPLIKMLALMPPPFLVGNSSCLIDLVPIDWVATELAALTRCTLAKPVTDPVTASAGKRRMSIGQMLDCIVGRINRFRNHHGFAEMSRPDFIPYRRWRFLQRSLQRWQPANLPAREFRYLERLLAVYQPYTEQAPVLPPRNTTGEAPEPEPVLEKSVDFWLGQHERILIRRLADGRSRLPAAPAAEAAR